MVMISAVIRCHPETSGVGATFGALSPHIQGSPPELEQSSAVPTIPSYTRREGVLHMLL
jgi:hypothetical protein